MVATPKVDEAVPASIQVAKPRVARVRDPSWEIASMVIGIPGAVISALLTMWLVMYGAQGNTLAAYTGIGLVLGSWLCAMTVVWIGTASVSEEP